MTNCAGGATPEEDAAAEPAAAIEALTCGLRLPTPWGSYLKLLFPQVESFYRDDGKPSHGACKTPPVSPLAIRGTSPANAERSTQAALSPLLPDNTPRSQQQGSED